MGRHKMACLWAAVAVLALGLVGQAMAQPDQPGQGRRMRDPNAMRERMEQFRQQASERMREQFGATEEEWQALQPKIEKVQTLSRQVRGGGMMARMGPGGPAGRPGRPGGDQPGGDQPGTPERQQSKVEKAMADLQRLLQNKESATEDIKAALSAYREARNEAEKDLAEAQRELRELLSVRQEAQAVAMGLLK